MGKSLDSRSPEKLKTNKQCILIYERAASKGISFSTLGDQAWARVTNIFSINLSLEGKGSLLKYSELLLITVSVGMCPSRFYIFFMPFSEEIMMLYLAMNPVYTVRSCRNIKSASEKK